MAQKVVVDYLGNDKLVSGSKPVSNNKSKSKYLFKKNLSSGVTNSEVKELQIFLNANGFIIAKSGPGSLGQETTKFGAATRAALIKFQKSQKIIPAIGYFGPATREKINNR